MFGTHESPLSSALIEFHFSPLNFDYIKSAIYLE